MFLRKSNFALYLDKMATEIKHNCNLGEALLTHNDQIQMNYWKMELNGEVLRDKTANAASTTYDNIPPARPVDSQYCNNI